MNIWLWGCFSLSIFVVLLFLQWLILNRRYKSSSSVASAYDNWTNDRLLERLWGEHVHLGYYGDPPSSKDFRSAKVAFVHELVNWSQLRILPPGSRVLDVGCGIGGSARILARDYGFEVLGISISPLQIRRASELTADGVNCSFEVMDALALKLPNDSFDAVWSVEAGPHMPDKQLYADELMRVLKPGGVLVVADWNRRDHLDGKMKFFDKIVMKQLLDQWAHPQFASIEEFSLNLNKSRFNKGFVDFDDWSKATIPSWIESIVEGFRRPMAVIGLGPGALLKGIREIPTILLMHWAFSVGLMRFGVFRIKH